MLLNLVEGGGWGRGGLEGGDSDERREGKGRGMANSDDSWRIIR